MFQKDRFENEMVLNALRITPFIFIYIWHMGVYDFQYKELKMRNKSEYGVVHALLLLVLINGVVQFFVEDLYTEESPLSLFDILNVASVVLMIPVIYLNYRITKKYLYARSSWWIIFELLIPLIGITTLTPTLLAEKKELSEFYSDLGPTDDDLV